MPDRLDVAAGRHRVEDVARHHRLGRDALHVDDWRGAGDGDGFLDGAHRHLRADRRGEARGQLDAFADHRPEPWQGERDLVGAGAKRRDLIAALLVGDGRARAFDQRGTAGLDRHARHDGAGRVGDLARYATLRPRGGREQQQAADMATREIDLEGNPGSIRTTNRRIGLSSSDNGLPEYDRP